MNTVLIPGKSYTLPEFSVVNTGDVPSNYQVSIAYFAEQDRSRPPEEWFNFSPTRFSLEPGAAVDVVAHLELPSSAHSGDYFALIKAQTVSETGGNTSLGVAAATKLAFEVRPSSWLTAQVQAANRWLDDASPWIYLVPASLLLGFLAFKARRLPFRIRFERR